MEERGGGAMPTSPPTVSPPMEMRMAIPGCVCLIICTSETKPAYGAGWGGYGGYGRDGMVAGRLWYGL